MWKDDINPFLSVFPVDFKMRVELIERRISYQKKNSMAVNLLLNKNSYMKASSNDEIVRLEVINDFENKMHDIQNRTCFHCGEIHVDSSKNPKKYICLRCSSNIVKESEYLNENWEPIWIDDDGNTHYDIPMELQNLTFSEKY